MTLIEFIQYALKEKFQDVVGWVGGIILINRCRDKYGSPCD